MDSGGIKGKITELIQGVLSEYGINISFLVIGLVLGWYLKFFFSTVALRNIQSFKSIVNTVYTGRSLIF